MYFACAAPLLLVTFNDIIHLGSSFLSDLRDSLHTYVVILIMSK